jgi:hypothetical protein
MCSVKELMVVKYTVPTHPPHHLHILHPSLLPHNIKPEDTYFKNNRAIVTFIVIKAISFIIVKVINMYLWDRKLANYLTYRYLFCNLTREPNLKWTLIFDQNHIYRSSSQLVT